MKVKITDLAKTKINGVHFEQPEYNPYKENFFEWQAFPMISKFKTNEVCCGLLQSWHHTPNFDQIEYHEDKELFYFLEGDAIMYFVDIKDGKPDMKTSQMVRIPAGTELEIEAGKGHFVAVAEEDYFAAMVISPKQDAPRLMLSEEVIGE